MSKNSTIQVRIDSQIKQDAREVLGELNMSISEAVGLFLKQVTLHKGMPFEVRIPNQATIDAMNEVNSGKGLTASDSVSGLMKDIND
ncbi:type II toxin-antitoxin system RelB/DinJ family antitoxin [Sedimentisphaera salicampi]|uniref:type II toxin-antitoxin system RelB/DinJ family antitoxin n=1 Tax=Sedimentisphaera salicampi TaxID=1941349 RepID=UPI000B9B85C1|nr:type II toxin-antitoxin system RelB/DinJ family antitoxin [Sedimentisphaera salicampi]OXU14307.1 Antitoxin DinJ [Sedimentisphaera salicampi]